MSSSDRYPYRTATSITQEFLNSCADNLTNQLEMICEIETPTGTIYISDRNKYVGDRYYEARMQFPVINRTIGEWLSEEIEFSTLDIELNNADGAYNSLLQGGAAFGGWVGKAVSVKLGLRDVAATYREIFGGTITEVGGVGRTVKSIRISARNKWDKLNTTFPTAVFTSSAYPNIENDKDGLIIPYILGDWTTGLTDPAQIPAIVVNGADPDVYDGARNPVQVVISINALTSLDTSQVWMRRGSDAYQMAAADITSVSGSYNSFSIIQNGATVIQPPGGDPEAYTFTTGDEFFVRVTGPSFGGYRDNAVEQARQILLAYGGITSGDFTPTWDIIRDKAAPAVSSVSTIKSRVWVGGEPQAAISYALSLLEQVRCEAFVDADGKLKLKTVHLEDFVATPSFMLRNWDVEKGSFQPTIDERTNVNRLRGAFAFNPSTNENSQTTEFFKNSASISQCGKSIDKQLLYPNLYVRSDVENQIVETLRISSAFPEVVECSATWRALLLDLGDFVGVNIDIGSIIYHAVPMMVRSIGYDPNGLKLVLRLWSMQMVPFPGWSPGYSGIVGGTSATITRG